MPSPSRRATSRHQGGYLAQLGTFPTDMAQNYWLAATASPSACWPPRASRRDPANQDRRRSEGPRLLAHPRLKDDDRISSCVRPSLHDPAHRLRHPQHHLLVTRRNLSHGSRYPLADWPHVLDRRSVAGRYGLFTGGENLQCSLGININLIWGIVLLIFGAACLRWPRSVPGRPPKTKVALGILRTPATPAGLVRTGVFLGVGISWRRDALVAFLEL